MLPRRGNVLFLHFLALLVLRRAFLALLANAFESLRGQFAGLSILSFPDVSENFARVLHAPCCSRVFQQGAGIFLNVDATIPREEELVLKNVDATVPRLNLKNMRKIVTTGTVVFL